MKIENIVKDCMMDVEWYVSNLFDWDRHHSDEKQTNDDINKPGGTLKVFTDGLGNYVHVIKTKHVESIPKDLLVMYDDSSIDMMNDLLNNDFYFCMLFKNNSLEPIFPNEIWLTYEAAVECCIKYL